MSDTQSRSLGTIIDERFFLRTQRLEKQKEVDELKKKEQEVEEEILAALKDAGLQRASGHIATASANSETVPTVTDWDEVYNYIQSKGYFHLLQRRVSAPAYRELLTIEGAVPGIDPTVITKLSITKASK